MDSIVHSRDRSRIFCEYIGSRLNITRYWTQYRKDEYQIEDYIKWPPFPDDISNAFYWMKICEFSIKISLNFVPNGPINNIPALVKIMAWRRSVHKPLSEPMLVSLLTHICVTRPQWDIVLEQILNLQKTPIPHAYGRAMGKTMPPYSPRKLVPWDTENSQYGYVAHKL